MTKTIKIIFILIIILATLFITGCTQSKYDSLAQCLSNNNATMYGTNWCSHCKTQKAAFGSSFEKINYIDCDYQKELCIEAGVTGYPTWIINNTKYPGEQPLKKLAYLTGCEIEPKQNIQGICETNNNEDC